MFKKSENVGNKGDFPELGDEHKKPEAQTKASLGGAIGQMSAPAKNTRTVNKFDGFQDN